MRMAIWHAGNTVANILSGFLSAGILENMDGIAGLHAWQWFFLIEGMASILVAVCAYMILPGWPTDSGAKWPHKKPFLTLQESEMAQYRVLLSNGGRDERVGGTWDGVRAACKDPFTWMFCFMHFGLTIAQSFKDFLPSVSSLHTGLLTRLTILDHRYLRLRQAHHLPHPSPAICYGLHWCLRSSMVLRPLRRVDLAYCRTYHCVSWRLRNSHLNPERWGSLLRSYTPLHRNV